MQPNPRCKGEQLLPLLVQTGVGLIMLLIAWLVIANLPMLERISFPLKFTLTELLVAILLTVAAGMLVNFALRIELRLRRLVSEFPQCGAMVKQFIYLIVILIAYFAFNPLATPYLENMEWLYHLLFLLTFLLILTSLGISIYSNTGELAVLFKAPMRQERPVVDLLKCIKCGKENQAGMQFCSFCGEKLPQPVKCGYCGQILKAGAKFCPNCGAQTEGTAPVLNINEGDKIEVGPMEMPSCISCNAPLKPGSKFCSNCGAAQE